MSAPLRSSPLRELTAAVWLCLCPGARFSAGKQPALDAGDWVDSKCGVLVVGQDSLADVLGDVQDRREAPECGDYGAG